jgi:muramoyltetrapeptide carboxypeptidase
VDPPKLHLIAPAGSCKPFFDAIGIRSAAELVTLVQELIGPTCRVTGNEAILESDEDQLSGGRRDDHERAGDIQQALADDETAAVVAVRGGAWFTRVLPLIDFSVLDRRTRPVAVFGFSELTSLVNIVAASGRGLGIYDMGPAFLTYALKRHASTRYEVDSTAGPRPEEWMLSRLRSEFGLFFRDIAAMIEGRGTDRPVIARLACGTLPDRCEAAFVGGNLTVLSAMIGPAGDARVVPTGRWLLLEDFNDKLERIDRFLAHLTLARFWDECEGILLGDFHKGYEDLTPAVLELLPYHIPPTRSMPVLVTKQVGHVWPMSPLPLQLKVTLTRAGEDYTVRWDPAALRTV